MLSSPEKLTKLTSSEIQELKSQLKRPKIFYFLMAGIWIVGLFLIFLQDNYYFRIGFAGFIIIVLLLLIYNVSNHKKQLLKDIHFGKKKIWKAKLDRKKIEKRGGEKLNILEIKNTPFVVSEEVWKRLPENSLVELHFAFNSKFVFQIKQLHK